MRPVTFPAATVAATLARLRVATLDQLVDALGGPSARTVFRKLHELDTLSSYSHRGQYYTLRRHARFNAHGLWAHGEIHFSTHGTLRATAVALTVAAPCGWQARELDALLGVDTPGVLRELVRDGQLARVKPAGIYVYCATDPDRQRRQLAARRTAGPLLALASPALSASLLSAAQHLCAVLNERQRRWGAGFASLLWGPGGDQRAAAWFGLHAKTVAKGRREVAFGRIPPGRVRRPGGGRKALVKKTLP